MLEFLQMQQGEAIQRIGRMVSVVFSNGQGRWPNGSIITYAFTTINDLPPPHHSSSSSFSSSMEEDVMTSPLISISVQQIVKVVRDSFDVWPAVVPFTFQQVDTVEGAHITITFGHQLEPNILANTDPVWNDFSRSIPTYHCTISFSTDYKWWAQAACV